MASGIQPLIDIANKVQVHETDGKSIAMYSQFCFELQRSAHLTFRLQTKLQMRFPVRCFLVLKDLPINHCYMMLNYTFRHVNNERS